MNPDYVKLAEQSRRIYHLQGISSLIDWDQETYMPEGAAEARGEQFKTLSGVIHQEMLSKKFTGPLSRLVDLKKGTVLAKGLSKRQKSALKEWHRDYLIENAMPKRFVEDFAKSSSEATHIWREARAQNNFAHFAPILKKIVDASRKKADYLGYKDHPYDALLDLYEPGMSLKTLSPIFEKLKKDNVALLKKLRTAPQIDDSCLYGNHPADKQMELSKQILKAMGYNFSFGRLDLSTHPFCSSPHPTDSRVTTRINPKNVFSCILTVMHEGGHSLYASGLPHEEYGTPLGAAISMGIHESQSRFWETRIGLSAPFVEFLVPLVKKMFPKVNIDEKSCYRALNKVESSFIRVEADEVTYPLHVILRFELEKQLIEGSLSVNEIPSAWNAKMQELLHITPPNDTLGCLQDVHWSMGGFGYFPTYALGNLYAAQLFTLFANENPNWAKRVAKGELLFIRDFLHNNVYRYGREFRSQELIRKVTGKPFAAEDYISYLNSKYKAVYNL